MEHDVHGKITGAGGNGGCVLGFYIGQTNKIIPDNISKLT